MATISSNSKLSQIAKAMGASVNSGGTVKAGNTGNVYSTPSSYTYSSGTTPIANTSSVYAMNDIEASKHNLPSSGNGLTTLAQKLADSKTDTDKVNDNSIVPQVSSDASAYDYASAVADAYQKMYEAQESARKAKQEALEKSNNESADRQIGLYNNQANRNRKQISDMTKGGTNGAMLSNILDTELWRGNGIHNTINTRDQANAEGESASYDTYANNISNLATNLSNLLGSSSSLDDDSLSKLRKRISEIYSNI